MGLIPDTVKKTIPPLYAQEKSKDPMVYAKLYTPMSTFTWFVTELDQETGRGFGYMYDGGEGELGYFLLSELEETYITLAMKRLPPKRGVDRVRVPAMVFDTHFTPKSLSEAKKNYMQGKGH